MPPAKHKQPSFGARVDALQKQARIRIEPSETARLRPIWRLSSVDWDGPFGWSALIDPGQVRTLWARLRDFESMSWIEIDANGSHFIAVGDLCKDARDRLVELKQDDIDELYSLRIAGKPRVFGFREANVLRILWWDPDHQVCPSTKK